MGAGRALKKSEGKSFPGEIFDAPEKPKGKSGKSFFSPQKRKKKLFPRMVQTLFVLTADAAKIMIQKPVSQDSLPTLCVPIFRHGLTSESTASR